MPVKVDATHELSTHLQGVMLRAKCHAPTVKCCAVMLAGAVIWRADPDSIERRDSATPEHGNIIWFSVKGHRYAMAYNHDNKVIEIRDRSQQGKVLAVFEDEQQYVMDKIVLFFYTL